MQVKYIHCNRVFDPKEDDGWLDPDDGYECRSCLDKIDKKISQEIAQELAMEV